MDNIIKPLGETISIATANTVSSARIVHVFNTNTTTHKLITIANSSANVSSINVSPSNFLVIEKDLTDTIQGTDCFGTKVGF